MKAELALLFSMPAAAAVHEAGHLLIMKLLKVSRRGGSIMPFGIGIYADFSGSSYRSELLCCLAGPMANLILGLWLWFACGAHSEWWMTMLAYGAFNMLPCGSLDGGRIVTLLLLISGVSAERAARIASVFSFLCAFALWTAAVYRAVVCGEFLLFAAASYLLFESTGS